MSTFLRAVVRDSRSDADDAAALSRAHGRHERPRAQEIPSEIDIDGSVPFCFFHVHHQGSRIDARVIDENIHVAEAAESLLRQVLHGGFTRYIDLHRQALRPEIGEFVGNRLGLVRLEIGHNDFGAFAAQTESDGPADSLGAAGHDRDFSLQSHGVTKPPFT